MTGRLRDNAAELEGLVQRTSDTTNVPDQQIEKDFWITEILRGVAAFSTVSTCTVVWKGGTSLSKAFHLIHRFSEDVDVTVCLPEQTKGTNDRLLKKLVADCGSATGLTPNVVGSETTTGVKRSARYSYAGHQGASVLLQIGTGGGTLPSSMHAITSMIATHVTEEERETYEELAPVSLRVLAPVRTLVEKLMILNAASAKSDEHRQRATARHYYDVWCLLDDPGTLAALDQTPIDVLATEVHAHTTALGLPSIRRPPDGFASSPAFDPSGNVSASDEFRRTVVGQLLWPGVVHPSFEECCERVQRMRSKL